MRIILMIVIILAGLVKGTSESFILSNILSFQSSPQRKTIDRAFAQSLK
jgi:hypothetical protein